MNWAFKTTTWNKGAEAQCFISNWTSRQIWMLSLSLSQHTHTHTHTHTDGFITCSVKVFCYPLSRSKRQMNFGLGQQWNCRCKLAQGWLWCNALNGYIYVLIAHCPLQIYWNWRIPVAADMRRETLGDLCYHGTAATHTHTHPLYLYIYRVKMGVISPHTSKSVLVECVKSINFPWHTKHSHCCIFV